MTDRPTLLRAADVAARWQIDLSTVYKFCRSGRLACRRLGGVVRIPLADVERIERGEEPCQRPTEDATSGAIQEQGYGTSGGLRLVDSAPEARASAIAGQLRKP